MKYGLILVTAVFILCQGMGAAVGAADTATVGGQPKAVFSHMEYKFDKVVDGTLVTHDFTVKNTGRSILEISRVKTG